TRAMNTSTLLRHPFVLFFILALLMLAPLAWLFADNLVDNTDLMVYMFSGKEFARQFWGGEFYPRWLMRLNDGLGAPIFYYYPPMAFWLGSLWPLPDNAGLWQLWMGLVVGTFASGVTCWLWLKNK